MSLNNAFKISCKDQIFSLKTFWKNKIVPYAGVLKTESKNIPWKLKWIFLYVK